MSVERLLPDVTSELLGGFSFYIQSIELDFATNSLQFGIFDDVEKPCRLRVLRFDRLCELHVTPHDAEDAAASSGAIDMIIGAHREGNNFLVVTNTYALSFSCVRFNVQERNI